MFEQQIEQMKQIQLFEINERKRSPNITNLAKTRDMFMSTDLFHSQNAGVHCLVYFIRYICYICC